MKKILALLMLGAMLTLTACQSSQEQTPQAQTDAQTVESQEPTEPETDTLEEMDVATAAQYHLGGYILFGRDFENLTAEDVKANIKSYQDASAVPMLIGTDEEGGTVVRASYYLRDEGAFLSPRDYYTDGGWEAVESAETEKADLLLSLGINVNLAPVCDVTGEPEQFMYERSVSGDADEVSQFVEKTVSIYRSKKLGSVLKHFPGYGDNSDTHTGIVNDSRSYSEFLSKDFKPFATGISAGADCILVSHNIVECMDAEYPASLSDKVHQLMRADMRFNGVIMTDDLAMGAISEYTGTDTAAVFAAKAGNDMLCCSDIEAVPCGCGGCKQAGEPDGADRPQRNSRFEVEAGSGIDLREPLKIPYRA